VLKLLAVSRCWKPTSYFTRFITPGEWSIVMTESVCVCLSASISPELQVRSSPKFCCILPVAVAWSSSGGTVRRSVLPVLWMTSCLLISQGCLTSPPSKFTCSLGLGYKRCAVIPVAGQQTHGPIFQALKVTPQVAAVGAESVVYSMTGLFSKIPACLALLMCIRESIALLVTMVQLYCWIILSLCERISVKVCFSGSCNGYGIGLVTQRSRVRLPPILPSGNNLRQVVKGQWCSVTRKVTVGLVSHWPCVTDLSGLSVYGHKA